MSQLSDRQTIRRTFGTFSQLRLVPIWTGLVMVFVLLMTTALPAPSTQAATGINSQLNFQGRLLTASGAVVPDGDYNMQFKIYCDGNGDTTGSDPGSCNGSGTNEHLLWTETWQNSASQGVTVKNGYFSLRLGAITSLSAVDWNQDTLWLSMNVGGTGTGGSPTYDGQMTPFKRLGANAYAFNAGQLQGLNASNFVQLAPNSVQADATNNASVFINKTSGTGNILQLQKSAADILTISNTGTALFQPTANSTSAFNVKNATGGNMFTIDTTNSRVGINLGANNTPSLAGSGVEVYGALRLTGGGSANADTFVTPQSGNVDTKINIPLYNPGNFSQILAFGLPSSASATSRAISIFDNRAAGAQPALAVFSPDEGTVVGFSWQGDNNTARVMTNSQAGTTDAIMLQSGESSGAAAGTGNVIVSSGQATNASSGPSGNVSISTGDSTGGNSGNILIDTGSAGGTRGTISIGTSHATGITVGNTGVTTTIQGNTGVTLNGTTGTTQVCRNGSGLLSSCDATYLAPTATNFIQNQNASAQSSSNFWISGTGIAATLQAATIDTPSGTTTLAVGTTNATTGINLNQNTVLAASKSLRITGGNTASRPASPTEGMVYYDTTTHQLLTYNNSKWVSDRTDAIIVAASNSSQADKDAADYVADGNTGAANDGDQVQINAALTAAAGKKVVLLAGTYTADATILIPNNTTLTGVGKGTLVQLADIDATDNLIENSDQAGTATGLVIRDLSLDGNKAANTGAITQNGIYFVGGVGGSGGSITDGATLQNLWIGNFETNGIEFHDSVSHSKVVGVVSSNNDGAGMTVNSDPDSVNSTITGSRFQNNGSEGLRFTGWYNWTITGNVATGNTGNGFYVATSYTTVSGNTAKGNASNGFLISDTFSSTITGNTANGNSFAGIQLTNSNNNTVSGNTLTDNGSTVDNNGISVTTSDSNTITGNNITDVSHSGTNYAITITNAGSDTNYLSNNSLGGGTINDSGTGTIYAGQIDSSGYIQFKGMTGANIQGTTTINTTGTAATTIGNTTAALALQGGSTVSLASSNGTNSTTLGFTGTQTAGNITYNLNRAVTAGTYEICTTAATAACVSAYNGLSPNLTDNIANAWDIQEGSNNYININTTNSSENISFGNATTNPSFSFLGSGTSTFNGNLAVAASRSLTITGGNTASRPGSPTEGMVYYDTTTHQLLQYNNSKWVSDRTDAVIVAASNSSQADKDAADYVADGNTGSANDGDQVQINAALTAAAGKKVVLLAGTYTADATILIPNNTTLTGVGQGTLVQLADIDATDNLIENSDTTTGVGIAIRDLQIDGQQAVQSGTITQYGIYLFHMGSQSTGRMGARISNVYIKDVRDTGIYLSASENNLVTSSTFYSIDAGGTAPVAVYNDSSANNSFTNNTFLADYWGLRLDGSSTRNTTVTGNIFRGITNKALFQFGAVQSSITGNTFDSNTDALILYTGGDSTVSSNTFYANTGYGITVDDSSSNTVSSNRIQNSGGSTDNNAIYIQNNSDSNTITGNTITDSSATVTNYAIRIASAGSDTNYLSNNSPGSGTINDSGTGTVYGGQTTATNGDFLFRGANSATAFRLQNANGDNIFNIDSSTRQVSIGTASATASIVERGTLALGYVSSAAALDVKDGSGFTTFLVDTQNHAGYLTGNFIFFEGANRTLKVNDQSVSNTAGDDLTVNSGKGNGTGAGGTLTLQAGASGNGATGNGGNVVVQGGAAASTNGSGGNVTISGGAKTGSGTSGSVIVKPTTTDNTAVFQVQNAAGTTALFIVDSTNARLYVGPTAGDTVGTLFVLGNKTNAGDPTGVEGGMYYNSNMKQMRCYIDSVWRACNTPSSLSWGVNFSDEFLDGLIDQDHWAEDLAGTGAGATWPLPDVAYRPGQISLETGTTTTGRDILWSSGNGDYYIGGGEEMEFAINLPTLADVTNDYVMRAGLCEVATADCDNGVYIEYDRSTSTNWRFATAKGGTRTKTSSSTAVSTGWHRFKIVVNSAGNSISYYMDGVSLGSAITTNIPDSNSYYTRQYFGIRKTAGTTNRTVKVDYFQYRGNLSSPR